MPKKRLLMAIGVGLLLLLVVLDLLSPGAKYLVVGKKKALPESREGLLFPDPKLERAIRRAIGKPEGELTPQDCASLTELDALGAPGYSLWTGRKVGHGIRDLTGIEHCTNLTKLNLIANEIEDLSPLSSLTELTWLNLTWNRVRDLTPLSSHGNLADLQLSGNYVSDISPLLANTGLGAGDSIDLFGNNLDLSPGSEDRQNIDILKERGARVSW